jgi:hypothetical protein
MDDELIGMIFKNNSDQEYQVLYISRIKPNKNKVYRIRFNKTGYERDIEKVEIKRGKIKDKLTPSVFGVGSLGEIKMVNCKKEYNLWSDMLERCYEPKCKAYPNYGGNGVTVSEHWKTFSNFLKDMVAIEGYDEKLFKQGEIFLDKDIKQLGRSNKIYSFDTCIFVSREINNKFRDDEKRKFEFIAMSPEGVKYPRTGLKEFCREFPHLNRSSVSDCLNGKTPTYKGWTFYFTNQ